MTVVPQQLQVLMERLPGKVARVQPIGNLPDIYHTPMFRIFMEGGETLKARLLDEAFEVQRIASLLPLLSALHFPQLCDWYGRAILEPWIHGRVLATLEPTGSIYYQAGRILAQVHEAKLPECLPAKPRSITSWKRHFAYEVEHLCQNEMLSSDDARLLNRIMIQEMSASSDICLVHRDFCAENLVDHEGQLVCIDNMSISAGNPHEDLARTFYRWPMSNPNKQQFLDGYSSVRDVEDFLVHETFWVCLVLVHAIYYQLQKGKVKALETLEHLKCWLRYEEHRSVS